MDLSLSLRNSFGGKAFYNITPPVVTGVAIVSQTLTCSTGVWSVVPDSFSYQWKRNGTNIASATSNTYVLVSADAGALISCQVTAGGIQVLSNDLPILSTLLDIVPNAAEAHSLRLLRGAYYGSPVIRLRRSGDSAETNIGVTSSGNFDVDSALSFVNAGGGTRHGYVVTIFDQSGNSRSYTQTTALNQPQIITAGAILIDGPNNRPAPAFNGTSHRLEGNTASLSTLNGVTYAFGFVIARSSDNSGSPTRVLCTHTVNGSTNGRFVLLCNIVADKPSFAARITDGQVSGTLATSLISNGNTLKRYSFAARFTLGNIFIRVNGGDQIDASLPSAGTGSGLSSQASRIGSDGANSQLFQGTILERILYTTDQTLNLASIEANQSQYYG